MGGQYLINSKNKVLRIAENTKYTSIFFLVFGVPTFGEGGEVKPVGTKSQVSPKICFEGSPKLGSAHTELGTAQCKQGCLGPAPILLLARKVENLTWKVGKLVPYIEMKSS